MEPKTLETLGIGLSRLLRYSYGGFLLIVFASLLDHDTTKPTLDAMSWQLASLAAVVVGAGLYATHRAIVVPVHHALLCLFWWIIDIVRKKKLEDSGNPTRWLGSLNVKVLWRIPAYTALRQSDLFKEEKSDWDIAHAETGLVLMTAEAFLLAAVYVARSHAQDPVKWETLASLAAIFFVFSFGGFVQHAVECRRFKQKKTEIEDALKDIGVL